MLNRIILIGRLTREPELRYTQSGNAVASFTLAVDRDFRSAGGERETDFFDIVTWKTQAENCARYLAKGSLCAVDGRLQTRQYEAKDGSKRKVFEVVAETVNFLDSKKTDAPTLEQQEELPSEPDATDDDLPF